MDDIDVRIPPHQRRVLVQKPSDEQAGIYCIRRQIGGVYHNRPTVTQMLPPLQFAGDILQRLRVGGPGAIFESRVFPATYLVVVEYGIQRGQQYIGGVRRTRRQERQIVDLEFLILIVELTFSETTRSKTKHHQLSQHPRSGRVTLELHKAPPAPDQL